MQVYINARFLTQDITGPQRYALEVVKALDNKIKNDEFLKKHVFTLLAPQYIKNKITFENISIKSVGRFKGHFWEQIELPYYARGGLLLNFCNAGPLTKSNQIVTIHDAAVFSIPFAYSLSYRIWHKILFIGLNRISRKIITDSVFSQKEIIRYSSISKYKINVIYLGAEHILSVEPDYSIIRKYGLRKDKYVLAVSSLNPNKNFSSIVQAIEYLEDLDVDFVIAGGNNPKVFSKSRKNLPDLVKYLGYVNDSELRALYENAACFIYPSFYEGFGLPPIEAMVCGCPVIVSQVASLPEVCGDAPCFIDPHSVKSIAVAIRTVLLDDNLRLVMRDKGKLNAKNFTWGKTVLGISDLIKEVLENENINA